MYDFFRPRKFTEIDKISQLYRIAFIDKKALKTDKGGLKIKALLVSDCQLFYISPCQSNSFVSNTQKIPFLFTIEALLVLYAALS